MYVIMIKKIFHIISYGAIKNELLDILMKPEHIKLILCLIKYLTIISLKYIVI